MIRTVGIVGRGKMGKGINRFLGGLKWPESSHVTEIILAGHEHLEALSKVDLILEAVIEDLAVKRAILHKLSLINPTAIIGTNTSSFYMSELEMPRAEKRFMGIHFSNPAHIMKMVELTRSPSTTEGNFEKVWGWIEGIGKVPIDAPRHVRGGIIDSVLFPAFEAAIKLAGSGVLYEDIDKSLTTGGGWASGPLRTMDHVGLDVVVAVLQNTGREVPEWLYEWTLTNRLGKKSGRGFYVY